MNTPSFYEHIEPITMYDPLSDLLGASPKGYFDYRYSDVVKFAGHSCPTVAGVYLMLSIGLKSLYPTSTPIRGEIRVEMRGRCGDGVIGVMGNIASFITGATEMSGFHGLNGRFDRRHLLSYDAKIEGDMALVRTDTDARVVLAYDPSSVQSDPRMGVLLPLVMSQKASEEEIREFGILWQERVRKILLEKGSDSEVIRLL